MWTSNNYTETDILRIHAAVVEKEDGSETESSVLDAGNTASLLSYLLYGKEIGSSGTPHLQCYAETPKKMTIRAFEKMLHKILPGAAKIQAVKFSDKARKYCMKDGEVTELGVRSIQGQRTDLAIIQSEIMDGATIQEIFQNHFGQAVRYHQAFDRYIGMQRIVGTYAETDRWPEVIYPEGQSLILWGESGIGKTTKAKQMIGPNHLMVRHPDGLLKFDRNFHTGIIFDDMEFLHTPRTAQIHLLDWDDHSQIHCRYACAEIPAHTKKVFTTNQKYGEIFLLTDAAIQRRVKIIELKSL